MVVGALLSMLGACTRPGPAAAEREFVSNRDALSITGLYPTGVDNSGVNIAAGAVDPHYVLTVSANPSFPGPSARQLNPPNGGWVGNGANYQWIGERADGGSNSTAGTFEYRITFNIPSGISIPTVFVTGSWACDDSCSIKLNGTTVPSVTSGNYSALSNFAIPTGSGFVTGSNTLTFVENNGGGPGGMLVASLNGNFACTADADCNAGNWCDNTNPSLSKCAAKIANGNPLSQTKPYATGVDNAGVSLADGSVDGHFALFGSSDPSYPGPNAFVIDNAYPIPPWVANTTASRWTGIQRNGSYGASGGVYTYRQTFSLNGITPSSATLSGNWACDDTCVMKLNGTTVVTSSGFSSYAAFSIPAGSPFVSGINTIDYVVTNSGGGPTGIRVDGLSGSVFASTPTRCTDTFSPISGAVGTRACASGVCDSTDNQCGYAVGSGPCTAGNAATVCRSGTCSGGVCSGTCNGNYQSGATQPCGSTLPICSGGSCISDPGVPAC